MAAGKSIRCVAEQLGHAGPALTLRVYVHMIPGEETNLSFLDVGGPGRPLAPTTSAETKTPSI